MKRYLVTAKLWVRVEEESEKEAQSKAKTLIDEALYEYVTSNEIGIAHNAAISKAKIIWVKEEAPGEAREAS